MIFLTIMMPLKVHFPEEIWRSVENNSMKLEHAAEGRYRTAVRDSSRRFPTAAQKRRPTEGDDIRVELRRKSMNYPVRSHCGKDVVDVVQQMTRRFQEAKE